MSGRATTAAIVALVALAASVSPVRRLLAATPEFVKQTDDNFTRGAAEAGRIVAQAGYEPCDDGFCLRPGGHGRLVYEIAVPASARGGRLRLWMHVPAGGSNAVWMSQPGRARAAIARDVESGEGRWVDLPARLEVDRPLVLEFEADNRGRALELPLDKLQVLFLTSPLQPLPTTWTVVLLAALWAAAAVVGAKRRRVVLLTALVVVVAIACRYADVRTAFERPLDPDAHGYLEYAQSLKLFSATGFYSASFGKREPLWILLAHMWFGVVGASAFHLRLLSVVLSTVAVWLVIRLGRLAGGVAVGAACGAVLALNGPLALEATRGLRLELELSLLIALFAMAFLVRWASPGRFGLAIGAIAGLLLLTRSTYGAPLLILVPMAAARLPWSIPRRAFAAAAALGIMVALAAPHRYGFYRRYGDPYWDTASYARAIANTEFAGTPGFPTRAEIAINGDAGAPMTLGHYLFALHTPREIAVSTVRGYALIFWRMGPCADPDGIAPLSCRAVNVVWLVLAGAGLLWTLRWPTWRWIAAAFVLLELPVAFLYDRNILELYRHSYQALPVVALAAVLALSRRYRGRVDDRVLAGTPAIDGRLRILYVIGTLDIGGTERQLVQLATGLDRTRFSPVVCCLASGDTLVTRLRAAGIPVEVIGLRKRSASGAGVVPHLLATLTRLWRFVAVVRRHRPAVVHGMLFWGYVFGTIAARATGVPRIVASRRSLAHFKDGKPSYVWLERLVNRWTDVFVANSQAVRDEVLRVEHVAPARVCVIYNGIDVAGYLRQPDPALRESLGIGATMPVATVVANFIHYKGHLVFLEAWQRVVARHADAVALLIGDGPLRDEIVRDISAAGLDRSVRVLGHRHDVPDLLAISDVCVHPSFEEGFSNAVLEALAAARPVVATAVGGTPEIVIPGRTGWLVPPRDSAALAAAILEVLADPVAAATRGSAGRRLVAERCDRQTAIARYQQIYLGVGTHSPCAESLDD